MTQTSHEGKKKRIFDGSIHVAITCSILLDLVKWCVFLNKQLSVLICLNFKLLWVKCINPLFEFCFRNQNSFNYFALCFDLIERFTLFVFSSIMFILVLNNLFFIIFVVKNFDWKQSACTFMFLCVSSHICMLIHDIEEERRQKLWIEINENKCLWLWVILHVSIIFIFIKCFYFVSICHKWRKLRYTLV